MSILAQPHPRLLGSGGLKCTTFAPKFSVFATDALDFYSALSLRSYSACFYMSFMYSYFFLSSSLNSLCC